VRHQLRAVLLQPGLRRRVAARRSYLEQFLTEQGFDFGQFALGAENKSQSIECGVILSILVARLSATGFAARLRAVRRSCGG